MKPAKCSYETALPVGYQEAKVVDAKNMRTIVLLNLAAFAVLFAVLALVYAAIRPLDHAFTIAAGDLLVFLGLLVAHIPLHELLHGLAYKLLTGQKLTFGMTLTTAYCGVPGIYVYRRTALIALLAPFVVFTVVLLIAMAAISNPWWQFLLGILLSTHLSGCVGDLYDTLLYLTRFRNPATLMQDNGPRQTFYVKKT